MCKHIKTPITQQFLMYKDIKIVTPPPFVSLSIGKEMCVRMALIIIKKKLALFLGGRGEGRRLVSYGN